MESKYIETLGKPSRAMHIFFFQLLQNFPRRIPTGADFEARVDSREKLPLETTPETKCPPGPVEETFQGLKNLSPLKVSNLPECLSGVCRTAFELNNYC